MNCLCGCGADIGRKRRNHGNHQVVRFVNSSHACHYYGENRRKARRKLCACGCGQLTSGKHSHHKGGFVKFVKGHEMRIHKDYIPMRKRIKGYMGIHFWLYKNYGKANHCERCIRPSKKYVWANKSHEYLRDISDWEQLCNSCHLKQDLNDARREMGTAWNILSVLFLLIVYPSKIGKTNQSAFKQGYQTAVMAIQHQLDVLKKILENMPPKNPLMEME